MLLPYCLRIAGRLQVRLRQETRHEKAYRMILQGFVPSTLSTTSPKIKTLWQQEMDLVVEYRAQHVAKLLQKEDCKHIIIHMEILAQLKEIAKRMHISANTLEDMAIKIM